MRLKRPKLVRDWIGGYVRFNEPVSNGLGSVPAGTVFKVTNAGVKAHFQSVSCDECGFGLRFTIKGSHKFAGAEWLGYEWPREEDLPDRIPPERFVMLAGEKYVAIDQSSGGYPHITDQPTAVKVWSDIEEAKKYRSMFNAEAEWQIREFLGLKVGALL